MTDIAARSIWDAPSTPDPMSRAAAASIVGLAGTLRREVAEAIARSPHGIAEWELEEVLVRPGNTIRPRIWELMRLGAIERTKGRGRTPSGRSCYLYVITDAGRAAL